MLDAKGFGATVDSEGRLSALPVLNCASLRHLKDLLSGHYFVDRSGFLFRYVLEYLRTEPRLASMGNEAAQTLGHEAQSTCFVDPAGLLASGGESL